MHHFRTVAGQTGCLFRINHVILRVRRRLPVYIDKQTFSEPEACLKGAKSQTHAPQQTAPRRRLSRDQLITPDWSKSVW